MIKAKARQDARRPRGGRMGVDVHKAHLDFGDAVRVGRGLRLRHERAALLVGVEHEVDERARPARRLLLHAPQTGVAGQGDGAGFGAQLAGDHAEQGGLARPVAPHKAHARPIRQRGGRVVEKQPRTEPIGEIVDMEHGPLSGTARGGKQPPGLFQEGSPQADGPADASKGRQRGRCHASDGISSDQRRSKRSAFITLSQAATKSCTNFFLASSCA